MGQGADFLQGVAYAVGVAGKLPGRGIRQVFALARYGGLDQTAEKKADGPDQKNRHAGNHDSRRIAAAPGVAGRHQQLAPGDGNDQDAVDKTYRPGGEAHGAVESTAETGGNTAL